MAEPEIKKPKDFEHINHSIYGNFFQCPQCKSAAIVLDKEYIKNNMANSISASSRKGNSNNSFDEDKKDIYSSLVQNPEEETDLSLVLRCANCNHRDLMVNFLSVKKDETHYKLPYPRTPSFFPKTSKPVSIRPYYTYQQAKTNLLKI